VSGGQRCNRIPPFGNAILDSGPGGDTHKGCEARRNDGVMPNENSHFDSSHRYSLDGWRSA
jgi:hypothetical protein